ncbi:M20/M25/M40 family metallo-hydrolase [Brevibacterium yomogidense]|uniref:M20/M25/M40 family metallo-hydrolase n=1 Tax=Brevibacterium yomogidense TaxID=946573 RepID=UPI002FCCEE5C
MSERTELRDEVVALTADLLRIDSVNPGLVPGGAGEARIADFVMQWLRARGFECTRVEPTPGRPSVLAVARGTGSEDGLGGGIMLNGHLDTVSLDSYDGDGLDPRIGDGRIHGRGTYDMKAGVAAMMVAAARVAAEPHARDIVLALVADEEDVSAGTEEVLAHMRERGLRVATALVAEPTNEDIVVAHRGFAWATVRVDGVAAHGSRPDLGVDPIVKAGRLLTGIGELGDRLAAGDADPLVGTGSVHASIITGGVEASSYADSCTVTIERRTRPGEDAATFEAELREILDPIAADDGAFSYELDVYFERPPFATADGSAVVAALRDAYAEVVGAVQGAGTSGAVDAGTSGAVSAERAGAEATVRGEQFWTDCALLAAEGIDAVLFGPAGEGAHAAVEWVDLDSLERTTRAIEGTVARLVV